MTPPADDPNSPSESLPASTDVSTSTNSSVQSAENQTPAPQGDTTASSPDAPVDDRAALLEVVRKAVEVAPKNPGGEGDAAALAETVLAADPNATSATTAADPLEADPTDAELAGMHPKTKARVDRLLLQRNQARTETETLKPDAAKWGQMHGFLTKHDLAPADVNLLLGAGAALRRGDYKAFRDGVMPYVELCNQNLGLSLPADLQTKVEAGEISVEAAKELSTTRLANARLAGQAKADGEAKAATAQQEQANRIAADVTAAITDWEAGIKVRDPDYAKKEAAVLRVSQALMAEHGRPTSRDQAVKLAKDAYAEVNKMFAGSRPAPVPTPPQPSGVRAVNGARPEPKTLMEAAMAGLERSRA